MIDFPKPIVASLKKPAQGLGAKLVSFCDLVCEEVRFLSFFLVRKGVVMKFFFF